MDNRAVAILFILLTAGVAFAEDWNLGALSIFTSINTTDINVTDGSVSNIPAKAITSGTIANARLPGQINQTSIKYVSASGGSAEIQAAINSAGVGEWIIIQGYPVLTSDVYINKSYIRVTSPSLNLNGATVYIGSDTNNTVIDQVSVDLGTVVGTTANDCLAMRGLVNSKIDFVKIQTCKNGINISSALSLNNRVTDNVIRGSMITTISSGGAGINISTTSGSTGTIEGNLVDVSMIGDGNWDAYGIYLNSGLAGIMWNQFRGGYDFNLKDIYEVGVAASNNTYSAGYVSGMNTSNFTVSADSYVFLTPGMKRNVATISGASPYIYQNTAGYDVNLLISGGTVTNIAFSADGTNYYAVASQGYSLLKQGYYVKVTYSSAPTIQIHS